MSKECFYPKAFQGKAKVVRWFYSRNNGCTVFYACFRKVSDTIEAESWADVSSEFTHYVEMELMPFCVENTDWEKCYRYGIEYNKKVKIKDRDNCPDTGCEGNIFLTLVVLKLHVYLLSMKYSKRQVSPTEYAALRSKTEGRPWTLNAITRALREGRKLPGVIEIQKHSRFYLLTVKVDGDQLITSKAK